MRTFKPHIFAILVMACFIPSHTFAQAVKKYDNIASTGLDFGWLHKPELKNSLYFPTINVTIERGLVSFPDIGTFTVGGRFGIHYGFHRNDLVTFQYTEHFIDIIFLPRATFYFQEVFYSYGFPENIDLYGGIEIGFRASAHHVNPSIDIGNDYNGFLFAYRVFVGARYYFMPTIGTFVELGYGLSFANIGLTFKY